MGTSLIDRLGAFIALLSFVLSCLFSWHHTSEFSLSVIFGCISAALTWLVYIVVKIVACDKSDPLE